MKMNDIVYYPYLQKINIETVFFPFLKGANNDSKKIAIKNILLS